MRDNNVDPPMITLQRLRVLKTVANEGRFSKAADILGITQPAVSLQIRQLESYCEGVIFERTGSGLILTELGSIVLRYADQILGLSDELEDATRQFTRVEKGSIKIGASSTPGDYIVPGLIGKFNDLYPKIDVSLHISNSETVMTMLNSREIDIGVGGVETADPALCSFPFEKDEIVIVCNPKQESNLNELNLAELVNMPMVTREKGSATRTVAEAKITEKRLEIGPLMELGSNEAVKSAVKNGSGLAMLSKHSITSDVEAGKLSVLNNKEWQCYRDLYVYFRCDKVFTPAQQKFIDLLREQNNIN